MLRHKTRALLEMRQTVEAFCTLPCEPQVCFFGVRTWNDQLGSNSCCSLQFFTYRAACRVCTFLLKPGFLRFLSHKASSDLQLEGFRVPVPQSCSTFERTQIDSVTAMSHPWRFANKQCKPSRMNAHHGDLVAPCPALHCNCHWSAEGCGSLIVAPRSTDVQTS